MTDSPKILALFSGEGDHELVVRCFERIRSGGIFETWTFTTHDELIGRVMVGGDALDIVVLLDDSESSREMMASISSDRRTDSLPIVIIYGGEDVSGARAVSEAGRIESYDFLKADFSMDELQVRLDRILFLARKLKSVRNMEKEFRRAKEKILASSTRDSLTGLFNRQLGMKIIGDEIKKADAAGKDLSLIICDVDYLRSIIDYYGREFADNIIVSVANLLKRLSFDDIKLVQWYGKSFIIVLPEHDVEGGVGVAGRIRDAMEATHFRDKGVLLTVTATFAVAGYRCGDDTDSLIDRLETTLRVGKRNAKGEIYY